MQVIKLAQWPSWTNSTVFEVINHNIFLFMYLMYNILYVYCIKIIPLHYTSWIKSPLPDESWQFTVYRCTQSGRYLVNHWTRCFHVDLTNWTLMVIWKNFKEISYQSYTLKFCMLICVPLKNISQAIIICEIKYTLIQAWHISSISEVPNQMHPPTRRLNGKSIG